MSVTFNTRKGTIPPQPTEEPKGVHHRLPNGKFLTDSQAEVFGRLRFDNSQIADYFGVSAGTIRNAMRRAELADAFRRGSAETVLAHRQKTLSLALAGSERMLIATADTFGQMDRLKVAEKAVEGRSRYSFDTAVTEHARSVVEELEAGGGAG